MIVTVFDYYYRVTLDSTFIGYVHVSYLIWFHHNTAFNLPKMKVPEGENPTVFQLQPLVDKYMKYPMQRLQWHT